MHDRPRRARRPNRIPLLALGAVVIVALLVLVGFKWLQRPVSESLAIHLAQHDITAAFHKRRLNFVILGVQEDEGNSDTIMLAHLDLDRRLATLISIPRDTWVEIPGHGHQKINAVYGIGGPQLTGTIVGKLTGSHVDSTIAVDPAGAKQIVDALGGLNINVEHDMDYDDNYGDLHIHLKKGEQFLTGGQVLEYMRFRHDVESDWGRMRRQQQVLHEIVRELGEPQNWSKIPHLVTLARKDVKTPLNNAQIQALVELYRGVPPDNVRTLTLPGRAAFVGDASVVLIDDWWAKVIGQIVCSEAEPPQGVVLVANASGIPSLTTTVVAALRGGGWNVQTAVEEQPKASSRIIGTADTAHLLAENFPGFLHVPGKTTVVQLGTDVQPKV